MIIYLYDTKTGKYCGQADVEPKDPSKLPAGYTDKPVPEYTEGEELPFFLGGSWSIRNLAEERLKETLKKRQAAYESETDALLKEIIMDKILAAPEVELTEKELQLKNKYLNIKKRFPKE